MSPILANYYIFDGLAVKAGIQPGFLLSGKAVAKGDGHTEKEDISGILHGADFAIRSVSRMIARSESSSKPL